MQVEVVADILDVDLHTLVGPTGIFALALGSPGANALHASVDNTVGVHLGEEICAAGQVRLQNKEL